MAERVFPNILVEDLVVNGKIGKFTIPKEITHRAQVLKAVEGYHYFQCWHDNDSITIEISKEEADRIVKVFWEKL